MMYVVIAPKDAYYKAECEKRLKCYNNCNDDFFPALSCSKVPNINFKFNGNVYSRFYLYKRPDEGSEEYNKCNTYLTQNDNYPMIPFLNRQSRLHTCFPFCKDDGVSSSFTGDDRVRCTSISEKERQQMICLFPDEKCEISHVKTEFQLFPGVSIAPLEAFVAIFAATPLTFLFDVLCILVVKTKIY